MDPRAIDQLTMPLTYGRHLTRLFDPRALFAGTGIRPEELDDPNLRITVRQAITYVRNTLALAEEPGWYLDWVDGLSDHFHGPVSLALSSAPTLGDGVDAFTRFFPSRIPYMHIEGRRTGTSFLVEMQPLVELADATPLLVETPLLILKRHLEMVYNVDFADATLELAYPATPHAERYGKHFGCRICFDAPRHALRLPAQWRGLPNLGYSASGWAHATAQCEATMGSSRERETLGQIRAYLCRAFERRNRERPLPTLNEVAAQLHVAPRTLIRRLRGLGTTYQEIMDAFLLARAQEMLDNDERTIKEISAALGFDNPTNFGKAFKRWCGIPPGSYRKQRVRADR